MAKSKKSRGGGETNIAEQQFTAGLNMVKEHPVFNILCYNAHIYHDEHLPYPQNGYAIVTQEGNIYCHPKIRLEAAVWAHVIAHCLLHLGMNHFVKKENPVLWNIACDAAVERFLAGMKFGRAHDNAPAIPGGADDEQRFYERITHGGIKLEELVGMGTAGDNVKDMVLIDVGEEEDHSNPFRRVPRAKEWQHWFAAGLVQGVRSAVDVAAGIADKLSVRDREAKKTCATRAREWFISSYPLLGAIASSFKIIEDIEICQRMHIQVAAVSTSLKEVYINPLAGLSGAECRFVMTHEFLHAALRHDARQEWRDAYLWNVACDFVINLWLVEMGVGERPCSGVIDEQFKCLSAESVYDRIVTDMRRFRKLATFRGVDITEGFGDILPAENGKWWERGDGIDLDAFYRRALGEGLSYHETQDRGYLPAGLVEEIRSLSHPPIPWDVELARWFDDHFTPIIKTRSYARLSRRQSSTPDIPRPAWVVSQTSLDGRTFGVVLDTSGSMERALLAIALGAIAGYSMARDVPAVRVVFCDACAYDKGYMKPDDIAGSVKVKGRGGTILQPGIDQLTNADDFPKDAPILIITDGECEDRLHLYGREHAFLLPRGAPLPFVAKGKVFRIRE
jgi:predicted metal-dependent peptidase